MIMLHLSGALPACTGRNRFTGAWMYLENRACSSNYSKLKRGLSSDNTLACSLAVNIQDNNLFYWRLRYEKCCQQRDFDETLPCSGAYLLQQLYLFMALDLRTAKPRHVYDMIPSRMVPPRSLFRVFVANCTDP